MKKITALVLAFALIFCTFGCSEKEPADTNGEAVLTSKVENAIELQKSIFICTVDSVSRTEALIAKYNSSITNYSVYSVNITESLDGYTPTGKATVYCMGTSEEFLLRIGLEQGGRYILDAEPWVYGDEIVYLLAPVTTAFPKIDAADRVTLAESEKDIKDCGSLEQYKKDFEQAKKNVDARIEGFSDIKNVRSRYSETFENVKTVTDEKWIRDYEYEWTPSDEFMEKTKAHCDAVLEYINSLEAKTELTHEDITAIFTK